jgi:hypothetical protein
MTDISISSVLRDRGMHREAELVANLQAEILRLGEEVEKGHEVALEVMRERDAARAEVQRLTEREGVIQDNT